MAKCIMFSELMFYAVIEGRKTQTRRVIPHNALYITYNNKGCTNEEIEII